MPGRFFLTTTGAELAAALGTGTVPGDPPRRNVAPGQEVIALTATGAQRMRWGLIPQGRVNARGRPVMDTIVNARSESVFDKSAFAGVGRAVVPANGWYEWTGAPRRKTAWAITHKAGEMLFFAAIYDVWKAPGGVMVPQVATVTCAPNADVRDIHHRMGVILHRADLPVWLGPDQTAAAALMRPFPDGSLTVAVAEGVDWDGP